MASDLDAQIDRLGELFREIVKQHGGPGVARIQDCLDAAAGEARKVLVTPSAARPTDRSRFERIIGDSPRMLEVLALVERVADSEIPILIQGESGTGKELIARAIHDNSRRARKPFVTENCAAIPETLQESELFGYKRGAFTGADRDRKGLFAVADGGTLFMDEVGDMSMAMQKKLLRALQDGEVRPVGGTKSIHVDVRVVSASNRLLTEMVARKEFREDLFYRLNGVTILLPPLRDRPEDIPGLARHFIGKVADEMGVPRPVLGDDARAALSRYRWPGNIRELENEIRRCLALLGGSDTIRVESLSDEVREASAGKAEDP